LAAVAVTVAGAVLGGWAGALVAVVLGVGSAWLLRRLPAAGRPEPSAPRSIAFVLDLMASAGSPPELAIAGVASAVYEHGDAGLRTAVEPLHRVGRLLQFGTEPAMAWNSLQPVAGYGRVADAGRRCASSGARLAGALSAAAAELRERHQAEALTRAERVGVWSLLPLGFCFLPAFVCLGVIPVILGVAGQVLSSVPT
jgi:pilus assembly protein TadC